MDTILRRGFLLGDRHINPRTGEITGPGGKIHVTPKAIDVLLLLAQRQGVVVGRDRIIREIWGASNSGRDGLTHCVSELRHALGDDLEDPTFIRTIPKRGYQLLASIRMGSEPTAVATQDEPEHAGQSGVIGLLNELRRRRVFRVVGAYAILAWVVVEVSATVFPPLGIPDWALTFVVWVAGLGFPVVAALTWALQITDKGIVFEGDRPLRARVLASPGRATDFAIIAVLGLIVGYLVYERAPERAVPVTIATEGGAYTLPRLDPDSVDPKSIAVLPFVNLGDDPRIDYLGMGLAEEVLNLLARIRELKVPSRTSSFYFHGKDIGLEEIAQRLRVRNVLEGSIQGVLDDLRISAQLIDSHDGYHVWSDTFARRNTDMLAVRDEIAQAVVDSLKVVLSLESKNKILERPTNNADAYDYYLQALSYLRRPRSQQTLDNAEGLFRRALDLDPEYALAFAGLCDVYLGKFRLDRRTEHVEPAEQSCSNALAIEPDIAEVHLALGNLYRHLGRIETAELAFQRAIVMNPKLEPAFYGLGMTYKAQDRLTEAEDIFRYAVDLEPGYWGTHLALGNYYLEFGQPTQAVPYFHRVTELNPEYAMGYNNLGAALYNSGQLEAGEAAYLRSIEVGPTEFAYSNMGSVYYNTSRFGQAVNMFRQAVDLRPHDYRCWGRLAFAQRLVPEQEQEAEQSFSTAIELAGDALGVNPNDWRALAYLAAYQANTGDAELALSNLDEALRLGPRDPHVHFFAAITHVALGNESDVFEYLENAAELGYPAKAIASDPDFRAIRNTDRYKKLVLVAQQQH